MTGAHVIPSKIKKTIDKELLINAWRYLIISQPDKKSIAIVKNMNVRSLDA